MVQQLLIADCVVDVAAEPIRWRPRLVAPYLVVDFATELEEPFVYAAMEVASE